MYFVKCMMGQIKTFLLLPSTRGNQLYYFFSEHVEVDLDCYIGER